MRWILIVLLLFIVASELDRRRVRRLRPPVKMYYNPINMLTAPFNLITAQNVVNPLDDNDPFPDMARNFPRHVLLRDNWEHIRDEVLALYAKEGKMTKIKGDLFFNGIIDDDKWKKFYIRFFSDIAPDARRELPYLCSVLDILPELKTAMISVLEPGTIIKPHVGPLRGCLRYHLCLQSAGPECWILVDGQRYSWKDGEDVVFDDTYIHEVKNESTTQTRIILFCDVQRELAAPWANSVNRFACKAAKLTTRGND